MQNIDSRRRRKIGGTNVIKNIVFDLGNVIFEWDEGKMAANFTNNKNEQELVKNNIFKTEEWLKLDEGILDYNTAIQKFKGRLPNNLKDKVEDIMNTWYTYMPIITKTTDLIKELKSKGYNIYILSNTHIEVYNYIKSLEIAKYIDGYLISAIEKMMKPNKKIYYRLFEKFNLVPEECFFIDDNKQNIQSSIDCGMKGHIFDYNNFEDLIKDLKENNISI